MAITTQDQLLAGFLSSPLSFLKVNTASLVAGQMFSLWQADGRPQVGATAAGTPGDIPTSATVGSFPFTNPTGGKLSYLARAAATGSQVGTLIVYDRLAQVLVSGTASGAVTVNSQTVNRPSGGSGEIWLEYTTAAFNARTITATYTNQAGTASRATSAVTGYANAAAGPIGTILPILPLSTSSSVTDTGARSVQTVTFSAANFAAGNVTIVIARRLAEIPIAQIGGSLVLDAFGLGMPQVYDSSCLALAMILNTTSTGIVQGSLTLAQG